MSKLKLFLLCLGMLVLIPAQTALAEPGKAAAQPEAATPAAPETSPIMSQPLDGTSVEAFEAGLTQVEKQARNDEYRKLKNSVNFLLMYDIAAKHDKAKLYQRLNGQTPLQIIHEAVR